MAVGEAFGQPSVAVGHHSEVPTQWREPKEENKQSRESWKMLSPRAGGTAFACWCLEPALCPPTAAIAGRAHSRQGGLGTQSPAPGWGGRETDTPLSADKPSRVLTLNVELFSLSKETWGKKWFTKKGEKEFLELLFQTY